MAFVNNPSVVHFAGYVTKTKITRSRVLRQGNNPLCGTPTRDPLLTHDKTRPTCKACKRRLSSFTRK
jgi:hypothetical protein